MFFFFNDTATTEIYTLSLHDALPISGQRAPLPQHRPGGDGRQLAWSALERGLRVQLRRPDTRSFAQLLPGERGADEQDPGLRDDGPSHGPPDARLPLRARWGARFGLRQGARGAHRRRDRKSVV